jgi:DNA-binding transcriptional regulator YdaS (Cro superfamily)
MSKPANKKDGLVRAIQAMGTRYRLAKALGISPAAVYVWKQIPTERIVDVERVTGIDRAELRPDLFRR